MKYTRRAASYAKALFNSEGSPQLIRQRQASLNKLTEAIKAYPKIKVMLSCPELNIEEKLALVRKMLNENLDGYVERLIGLALKRGDTELLPIIAIEYKKLVSEALKNVEVEISAFEPLTGQAKQLLAKKLESKLGQKVYLVESIDKSLLGGFTLLIRNQMLDMSLKRDILNLKKQLLKAEV